MWGPGVLTQNNQSLHQIGKLAFLGFCFFFLFFISKLVTVVFGIVLGKNSKLET